MVAIGDAETLYKVGVSDRIAGGADGLVRFEGLIRAASASSAT